MSTLELLDATRFSLLASRATLRGLAACEGDEIALVDASGFPAEWFPEERVLLVRPDGHVAWWARASDADASAVAAALGAVLGRGPAESSATS